MSVIREVNDLEIGYWNNHGHFLEFRMENGACSQVNVSKPVDRIDKKTLLLDTAESLDASALLAECETSKFACKTHAYLCREEALATHRNPWNYYVLH